LKESALIGGRKTPVGPPGKAHFSGAYVGLGWTGPIALAPASRLLSGALEVDTTVVRSYGFSRAVL